MFKFLGVIFDFTVVLLSVQMLRDCEPWVWSDKVANIPPPPNREGSVKGIV